ncbi:pyridoxine/pyridoxamine 5'-phosphate oxidase [Canibacter zhoujuaniae]|uniref:pyridoxine/pyridoxamine 5'-phosphate oxidase n=1 Tax=Canibacter zhoujuaniae TaxID=2708343 RepID=UPI0014205FD8|nr:pyridoxal 5'-phosphate synthase [Canibacter zhoujuaniae]
MGSAQYDQLFTETFEALASGSYAPLDLLTKWWQTAESSDIIVDHRAAALATFDAESGYPDSRIVYVRPPRESGFEFYTDRSSVKGVQLQKHPQAAITMLWHNAWIQVRVRGDVTLTSRDSDLAYWQARPVENRLAGYSSQQSQAVASEAERDANFAAAKALYQEGDVPLPERWGGFVLLPREIEFWRGTDHRMHRRVRLQWQGSEQPNLNTADGWSHTLLNP